MRIGSVPYLNAAPLVYGIENQITFCVPSRLADLMHRGEMDVGLVPVAEVLTHDLYDMVDGIAIASCGPVRSVFLAYRLPVEKLRRVAVDPASRSSAWLVRIILKYRYGIEPEFYPCPAGAKLSTHEAMMLIGDDALWYATRAGAQPVLDLGKVWQELTGWPFVFAVWAIRRGVNGPIQLLQQAKANGLAHLEDIVQNSAVATPEFRRQYLTECVCYDLGDAEKCGLRRYQQYLNEMGLIERCHDLRYIS